jgi:hypothetical protein
MALTLLTVTEPLWTSVAVASVFVCHLLGLGPSYLWIGLGVASLTVPLHLINRTASRLPTRFDLPLALLMIGALIGLITSPNRAISLGAFQCMLALSLLYYSWVNYSRLSSLIKCVMLIAPAAMLVSLLLSVLNLPSPSTQPNFDFGGVGTHHGLALALVILIAVLAGIAVFSAQPRTRLIAGIACLSFTIITFVLTWDSIQSLLAWDSITGRLPIWGDTLDMLADAPLAGLGLGCWALTYHGTAVITSEITHAHNAYLELYSNTGILGAIAFVFFLAIGLKLAWVSAGKPLVRIRRRRRAGLCGYPPGWRRRKRPHGGAPASLRHLLLPHLTRALDTRQPSGHRQKVADRPAQPVRYYALKRKRDEHRTDPGHPHLRRHVHRHHVG